MRIGGDGIAAIVLIALGVLGWIEASGYPEKAGIWPKWMLGSLILLAVVLLVQSAITSRRPPR